LPTALDALNQWPTDVFSPDISRKSCGPTSWLGARKAHNHQTALNEEVLRMTPEQKNRCHVRFELDQLSFAKRN
jgi:hypothetical protein